MKRNSTRTNTSNFNPRSPTRGATGETHGGHILIIFQSTLPYAGSDRGLRRPVSDPSFQSTLPYAGSDFYGTFVFLCFNNFNPRSPTRGATRSRTRSGPRRSHFNPRSPTRGATGRITSPIAPLLFQSTLPYAGSDSAE